MRCDKCAVAQTFGDLRYVLLWSAEHRAWWCADGLGYTTKIDEAGLYDPLTVEKRWRRGNEFVKVVRLGAVTPCDGRPAR